ncbi:hypothetical protein SAMN05660380_00034 [Xylella fastidiosa]|nr:hypothetical protein SAMN05660380_00034 [Xylella fastidiosa]
MAVAACAEDFGADHAVAGVVLFAYMCVCVGFEEARPASARFEFGVGVEEGEAAEPAGVGSKLVVVQQSVAERCFCAVLQEDAAFFGVECGNQCFTLRWGWRG